VLFEINDGSGRLAEVHLTWRGSRETLPWPMASVFDGIEHWRSAASDSTRMPIDIELATALLDYDACSTHAIQTRFSESVDAQTKLLIAQASSLHDRFALALRQIPVSLALALACDFAEHALISTSQNRNYDWQQSEGNRNEEALAKLRTYINADCPDPPTILKIKSCVSYLPFPSPGISEIAAAATDTDNAAKHVYKMAKLARQYVSYRGTGYPHHNDVSRKADHEELLWQIQHNRASVYTLAA
jgi:hypothetical protein